MQSIGHLQQSNKETPKNLKLSVNSVKFMKKIRLGVDLSCHHVANQWVIKNTQEFMIFDYNVLK